MTLDGADRDEQASGDLRMGQMLAEQRENLRLTLRDSLHGTQLHTAGSGAPTDAHATPTRHRAQSNRRVRGRSTTMGSASVQGPLWGARAHDWASLAEAAQTPFY